MSLIAVGGGESVMLQLIVSKISTTEPLDLRLFTNNHTPGYADVVGTYTEASGNGYALIALTGASWSVSGSDPATIAYAQQTFTFTGNLGNVYGYLLTRHTTGDLIIAEKFSDGPYNIVNNGDQIKITPSITCT